ncbi:hypothetical protein L3X38_022613 [Prunus dulcis]|uniref:Uncharacterized protein n=1 Tax=Prunus dulcis TaxID=3755 RepID=A0AAD4Z4R5_PRUDU|nr:hypothetical protein L3X38_022613 [Prunus dulcis]
MAKGERRVLLVLGDFVEDYEGMAAGIWSGTIGYGIWYKPTTGPRIFGYTYSDWVGSVDDMKNTSGYAFTIGSGIFKVIKKTRYRDSIISIILWWRMIMGILSSDFG